MAINYPRDPVIPPSEVVPPDPSSAEMTQFWRIVDARATTIATNLLQRKYGVARARYMTLNVPIAGSDTPPVPGWLTSVVVSTTCKVIAWHMMALVSGTIQIDIMQAVFPTSPSTPPSLFSMPGPGNLLAMNGYTAHSQDTSAWSNNQIPAGSVLHFFIDSVVGVQQAVLGLRLQDLDARMLQP